MMSSMFLFNYSMIININLNNLIRPRAALNAIKKRLNATNPNVQLLSLQVRFLI